MSRRFIRHLGLLMLLFSSQAMAIGLGDIRLSSALNEPLRAEIVLLSATADEIADLKVDLASEQTFARYGIDRPFFLQGLEFNIRSGSGNDQIVEIRSRAPITEPFLTFLVEATWSSGRLLREYTVLLDPPTYAPPAVQQPAAVTAPQRSTTPDSGRIQSQTDSRPAPVREPSSTAPARSTPASSTSTPKPQPPASNLPYDSADGGDYVVQRSETLWGIAARLRPDSRLTMNQTMLAIYEANRDSFGGNINMLREGASLRIPSADRIFQISRGDALSEVQRQHSAWGTTDYQSAAAAGDSGAATSGPSLTLVPPDEEPDGSIYDAASVEPLTREEEVENRIAELEAADVPDQQSLIEIRDNELASLRQELADIRGEVYEPLVDESIVDEPMLDDTDESLSDDPAADSEYDEIFADEDTSAADDAAADEVSDEVDTASPATTPTNNRNNNQSLVDRAIEFLTGIWGIIIGAVVLVLGALFWFMRRGSDDDDSGPWASLDDNPVPSSLDGDMSATESLQAPGRDDAFVVVEGDTGEHQALEETVESPAADGDFGSLEDTFSSETAVNLDQTDPIAEADFHMAYGLYDQAADLINGALETDPGDKGLMSKLCEIYFVWGNRDAFVDAASNLKAAVGDDGGAEWDKIVIMGQQIAADHSLFAGVVGATKAVDLAFDDGGDADESLDMDFGATDGGEGDDVIDLGGDSVAAGSDDGVDFNFDDTGGADDALDLDLEATAESPTISATATEETIEMPARDTESPTIEEPFNIAEEGTSELPSLDESLGAAIAGSGLDADATAEINLDDLDLDVAGLAETELDDLDATGQNEALVDVSIDESLLDSTGRNPEIDADATGVREALDATDESMRLATDETGRSPMVDVEADLASTDFGIDDDLLDATGKTQVLSDEHAVAAASLGDDDATMLAPGLGSSDAETVLASLDDDSDDFDFAKTEALPADAYTGNTDLEETAESKTIEDFGPDLDDLASALEGGDTVEQVRDDATVEQPRPSINPDSSAELPTMSLAPDDMSDDLQEARTMTEVGTKLDLARAYVDMGDPAGARSILEEVLDEGDAGQKQQAQQLLDSLPS